MVAPFISVSAFPDPVEKQLRLDFQDLGCLIGAADGKRPFITGRNNGKHFPTSKRRHRSQQGCYRIAFCWTAVVMRMEWEQAKGNCEIVFIFLPSMSMNKLLDD